MPVEVEPLPLRAVRRKNSMDYNMGYFVREGTAASGKSRPLWLGRLRYQLLYYDGSTRESILSARGDFAYARMRFLVYLHR